MSRKTASEVEELSRWAGRWMTDVSVEGWKGDGRFGAGKVMQGF
jgi:hypothetical protein